MIFDFLIDIVEQFIVRIAHPDMLAKNYCHVYTDDHRYAGHGCWFLSPRVHAINLVYIPPLFWTLAYYLRQIDLNQTKKANQLKTRISDNDIAPYPAELQWASITLYVCYAYFKIETGEYWRWMHNFAFCNIAHLLVIVCCMSPSPWLRYHLARFIGLLFVFLAGPLFMPDYHDLSPIEVYLAGAIHVHIPLFSAYNIYTNRLDFTKEPLIRVVAVACFVTPLYVWSQTILSLVSSVNVNYMLSPPPTPAKVALRILGEDICQWGHVWGSAVYVIFFVIGYFWCLKVQQACEYYKWLYGPKSKQSIRRGSTSGGRGRRRNSPVTPIAKGGATSSREQSPVFARFNQNSKNPPKRKGSRVS